MGRSSTPTLDPIPARTVPRPWEDLASYISRIAAEIGYRKPGWILQPEGIPSTVQPYNLCTLRREADYQLLERLLYMDEAAVYGLTLHRFALCLLDPDASRPAIAEEVQRPLLTRHIFQTFFRPYSATKVCSVCLTEVPAYGRLYWRALPVVVCLRHRVFLKDRCPVCQRPIPLFRPSITNCPRCQKGDYREANIIHMPEDPFFLMGQALILRNFGVQSAMQNDEIVDASIAPLLRLLPWQYFLLLDAFRCILGPLLPDAPFLRVGADMRVLLHRRPRPQSELSMLEWSVIIATVHAFCTSWPDNFFSFLEAFPSARSERRRERDRRRATGLQRDFGVFYEKWLYKRLSHPAFAFLHEAFETYLGRYYTGGEVTKRLQPFRGKPKERLLERPYLTKAQTKAVLGIGEDVFQELLARGSLSCLQKPIGRTGKRTMFLIERGSVEAVQREWAELLPLNAVAQSYLGVTKGVLLMLEQARLLVPARGPFVDGYKFRLYRPGDVAQFIMQFLARAVKVPGSLPELLPLARAACKMGISLATVLRSALEGELTLFDLDSAQPVLRRLALSHNEVQSYLNERERQRYQDLSLLTVREAASLLGVSAEVLQCWIREGLLASEQDNEQGRKPRLLIRREALAIFRSTYLFTEEVAKRMGVTPSTVHKYVRKGIISPVAGRRVGDGSNRLLFVCKDVEALMPAEGLTVREAAKTLGVGPARVYALLKSGTLTGIAGYPGTPAPIRVRRSDVEAYRQDKKSEFLLTGRSVASRMEEHDDKEEE